jgi:hypothetical protein
VPPVGEKVIQQHLRDLDNDDFATRQGAEAELAKILEQAEPVLRRALEESESAEVKRRIGRLLGKFEALLPERLRQVRAVEVLECIGTAPARHLLAEIAGGAGEARLTREARAALARLKGTAAAAPRP